MCLYKNCIKRVFDLVISLILLFVLSPLFILIIILLLVFNKGNPFFLQLRPGRHELIFKVIKFKTMNDLRDMYGNTLPDDVRLTWIGKFIRKTSFDELPQLINVIKGDMSIVGPRPLLVEYLPLYNEFQKRRHEVRPGITGWAQVNGRNAISWEDKFNYDVYYVDNISFLFDLKILWFTILKVIIREGINQDGQATAEKFKGNN